MIRGDDDERGPRERRQPIEERTERAIDERHLAVVRLRAVLRGEIVGRPVRRMRIERVHPREELARLFADPVGRARDDDVRAPLGQREVHFALHLRHLIVVDIEPRREAEALRDGEAADEGAGREAQRLQHRRERGRAFLDAEAAVVAHAVFVRQTAGQDRRVRRQRHHRVRMREREPRAVRGQAIEVGRLGRTAVARKRVAAQGVDRDQQDVLVGTRRQQGERLAARPPPRQRRRERDDGGRAGEPARRAPGIAIGGTCRAHAAGCRRLLRPFRGAQDPPDLAQLVYCDPRGAFMTAIFSRLQRPFLAAVMLLAVGIVGNAFELQGSEKSIYVIVTDAQNKPAPAGRAGEAFKIREDNIDRDVVRVEQIKRADGDRPARRHDECGCGAIPARPSRLGGCVHDADARRTARSRRSRSGSSAAQTFRSRTSPRMRPSSSEATTKLFPKGTVTDIDLVPGSAVTRGQNIVGSNLLEAIVGRVEGAGQTAEKPAA